MMAAILTGCPACEFSQFDLTPTGRIKDRAGRCLLPVPVFVLPVSMRASVSTFAIWRDMGKDCPTFKQKGE
jgi:hypothetical protein